jgi:alkanesulfonate monooxygenase SsuD/methylene tetrahydromethanopterin reductase-like flavin-dependent oxidoreductase (luciferase family)
VPKIASVDHASRLDALTLLTYAAALTSGIRLGVSVPVLPVHSPIHVAPRVTTLDYLSGGRAVLGVGLVRDHHDTDFQVPRARRLRRFREAIELMSRGPSRR